MNMDKVHGRKQRENMHGLKGKSIAYLRVSADGQDLEKNKADILSFANSKDLGKVEFVEEKNSGKIPWRERKIKDILDQLQKKRQSSGQ